MINNCDNTLVFISCIIPLKYVLVLIIILLSANNYNNNRFSENFQYISFYQFLHSVMKRLLKRKTV